MLRAQRDLAVSLSGAVCLEEGLSLCLDAALKVSGMDCGGVHLLSRDASVLEMAYHRGVSPAFAASVPRFDTDSANTRLVMEGRSVYARHPELGVGLQEAELREGLRAVAIVPITNYGKVVGCMTVASHSVEEVPTYARSALEAISAQMGCAIARLNAQEELNSFITAVNAALEGVLVIDCNGVVTDVSEAVVKKHGLGRKEDMIGKSGLDFVAPEDRAGVLSHMAEMFEKGFVENVEYRIVTSAGQLIPVEVNGVVLKDRDGKPTGAVVVARDVTEKKRVQEELDRHRHRLETLVEERTSELRAAGERLAQLYEGERRLRQRLEDEMKKRMEFARALTHELKTPLTPILMSSEALGSQLEDERYAKMAQSIHRSAVRLNSRIDELLDLAKGEIGMLRVRCKPLDMRPVIEGTMDSLSPVASKRSLELVTDLADPLPLVWADATRIRQVLSNLLDNALKFSPDGGRVTVRGRKKGTSLTVEITDAGPGIARQDRQTLFQPYERRSPDGELNSGLGLGLSLCKMLVELHGGTIWVRSRVGKGSTFGFSVPLHTPASPPAS